MIRLTDEIAITADDMQYIVGRPYTSPRGAVKIKNPKYYHKLSAALQQAVTDCVRAGVADERITELRQVVAEQARLEQEFSEKLKGGMSNGDLRHRVREAVDRAGLARLCPELPRRGTESGRHAGSQS